MSLSKLRRLAVSDPRVQHEFREIRAEAAFQREVVDLRHPKLAQTGGEGGWRSELRKEVAQWGDLFRRGCVKRTVVGTGLM